MCAVSQMGDAQECAECANRCGRFPSLVILDLLEIQNAPRVRFGVVPQPESSFNIASPRVSHAYVPLKPLSTRTPVRSPRAGVMAQSTLGRGHHPAHLLSNRWCHTWPPFPSRSFCHCLCFGSSLFSCCSHGDSYGVSCAYGSLGLSLRIQSPVQSDLNPVRTLFPPASAPLTCVRPRPPCGSPHWNV